jgi:hypothetical protein
MDTETFFVGLACFGPILLLFLVVWAVFAVFAAGIWMPVANTHGLRLRMVTPWRRQRIEGSLHGLPVRLELVQRARRDDAWSDPCLDTQLGALLTMARSRRLLTCTIELPGACGWVVAARSTEPYLAKSLPRVDELPSLPAELRGQALGWKSAGGSYDLFAVPGFTGRLAQSLERLPFSSLENAHIVLRLNGSPWRAKHLETLLEEAGGLAALIAEHENQ